MTHTVTFLLIVLLASFSLQAYADKPTPGMYSITTKMESDMPMPVRTQTMTECLTEEDIQQDPKVFLGGQQGIENCDISDYSIDDGKMTMSMVCETDGGQMTMRTEGTYDANGYKMTSNIQMTGAGMTFNMKTTGVGTRIGDC